ncbi:hypothetical protein BGZ74_009076 [Mortierella antarctica]|nr:hypothetical protein BGZ74_009076 [Mortierella antarctica]
MSNEKIAHENPGHPVQPVQPVVAINTNATSTSASSQPSAHLTTGQPLISPISPSKSTAKKTGTRSTFCPNTLRKGTKLTDADYEFHEKDQPHPAGWFDTLCKKKTAAFGDCLSKADDPHDHSYY